MEYVITSHVLFQKNRDVYGPAHHIFNFLKEKGRKVIFIKHSIYNNHRSVVVNNHNKRKIGKFYKSSLIIKSVEEVLINIRQILKLKKPVFYIAVDPVNALSGVILHKQNKLKKFIYLTADYADRRFDNHILNWLYHQIDRLCLRYADEVWSVSSRIVKKRKQQGVPDTKNKFFPNSPSFSIAPREKYDGNLNLIVVSHLSKSLNLNPIFDVIQRLAKKYKKIHLNVIGEGSEKKQFQKKIATLGIKDNVTFFGQKNHKQVLKCISKSFLGIALYTADHPWRYYGDSMKAREYAACGIPIIMNDIPSTSDDVKKYKAGLVIRSFDTTEIYQFIEKCIISRKFYTSMRTNASLLGKQFDKEKLLNKLLHE